MSNDIVLITGAYDNLIRFWRAAEQKCIATIDFETTVTSLAISPNKQYIAACGFNQLKVFRVDNQQQQAFIKSDQESVFSQAIFSQNGEYLYATTEDGALKVYDTKNMSQIYVYKNKCVINSVSQLNTNNNPNLVLIGDQNGKLQLFDIKHSKTPINQLVCFDIDTGIRHVSSVQNKITVCDCRGIIQLYEYVNDNFKLLFSVQAHADQIHKTKLTNDLKYLVSASSDRTCKIFDLDLVENMIIKKSQIIVESTVLDFDFNSNCNFLLVACDKCPKLFNILNGQFEQLKQYGGHARFVTAVSLAD